MPFHFIEMRSHSKGPFGKWAECCEEESLQKECTSYMHTLGSDGRLCFIVCIHLSPGISKQILRLGSLSIDHTNENIHPAALPQFGHL